MFNYYITINNNIKNISKKTKTKKLYPSMITQKLPQT